MLQFYATFILQFTKGAYSKRTMESVHLLRLKCCSRPRSLSHLFFWTILAALRLFKQFQFKIRATKLGNIRSGNLGKCLRGTVRWGTALEPKLQAYILQF